MIWRSLGVAVWLLLACPLPAWAQAVSAHSGLWSDPATWAGRTIPDQFSATTITPGLTVECDGTCLSWDVTIQPGGMLRHSRTVPSLIALRCNLLDYGYYDQGTEIDPIPWGITANLNIHLTQAQAAAFVGGAIFRPTDCGVWNFGRWDACGGAVTRTWGELDADAPVGATSLTVAGYVGDWPVGGMVVVTTTAPPPPLPSPAGTGAVRTARATSEHAEYATIAAASGSTLTLSAPLLHAHQGTDVADPEAGMLHLRGAVGLITRNVTVSTTLDDLGDIADVRNRHFAHAIFMPNTDGTTVGTGGGTGNLQYLAFVRMGDYGKTGDYALHYHRLGEGGRGLILRGASFYQTGFRCVNPHESNGLTFEDDVCVQSGGGSAFFQQVDGGNASHFGDLALIHNLVVENLPKHELDESNQAIAGEHHELAAAFWGGAIHHSMVLGNRADGGNATETGFFWQDAQESRAGTVPQVYAANTASGFLRSAFYVWTNQIPNALFEDIVQSTAWHSTDGFLHGAYHAPIYLYNSLFAGNHNGYQHYTNGGYLQDSVIVGRGSSAPRIAQPDYGINIKRGNLPPELWYPSRFFRNVIVGLTPSNTGAFGIGIGQEQGVCPDPAEDVRLETGSCDSLFVRMAATTFGANLRPLQFGASRNADTYWIDWDRGRLLMRADQATPTSQLAPFLVTPAATYQADADAVGTPLASLPSAVAVTGLLHQNGTAYRAFTLDLSAHMPPKISLQVALAGTVAALTATPLTPVTQIEILRDGYVLCTLAAAPWTCSSDLAQPIPGDIMPPRHYTYLMARAFNGTTINSGYGEFKGVGLFDAGLAERGYSAVTEIGPEVLLGTVSPPPPDPTLDELRAQVAALQAQLAQLAASQTSLQADNVSLTQRLAEASALLAASEQARLQAEQARDLAMAEKAAILAQLDAVIAQLHVIRNGP